MANITAAMRKRMGPSKIYWSSFGGCVSCWTDAWVCDAWVVSAAERWEKELEESLSW